jgi:hypothetical protein
MFNWSKLKGTYKLEKIKLPGAIYLKLEPWWKRIFKKNIKINMITELKEPAVLAEWQENGKTFTMRQGKNNE